MLDPEEKGEGILRSPLEIWRQGDCVVQPSRFLGGVLRDQAGEEPEDWIEAGEQDVPGFIVVSQTCDIVRKIETEPNIVVAPLVEVSKETHDLAKRMRLMNLVHVPGLGERRLLGDLLRLMTLEKECLLVCERIRGCITDVDSRRFQFAVQRKFSRIAAPDWFTETVSPLRKRLLEKHDKASEEGTIARALSETRVRAEPERNAASSNIEFLFVVDQDASPSIALIEEMCESWMKPIRAEAARKGHAIQQRVVTLDEMTAREYVESDPLDLQNLTVRRRE